MNYYLCFVYLILRHVVFENNISLPLTSHTPNRITSRVIDTLPRQAIVATAKRYLGIPYVYGASNPRTGFDCSGFLYYVFVQNRVDVPRSTAGYAGFGTVVPITTCLPGDLLLFTGTNAAIRTPGHIGLVIKNENGHIEFIHASSGKAKGVTITPYGGAYIKRFLKAIRVKM